jgi:hypothetical protein
MTIPLDKMPASVQDLCTKTDNGYVLDGAAVDNIMSYFSQKLALVLPDTSTDWHGSLYADFKGAMFDSVLVEGLGNTLSMKTRAVNEMINTNSSKVTLVQTAIDNFKHNFDTLLASYSQFINRL